MDDAFVEYFTDQALALQGQESNELPALRRQLADTEKAIDNMLNAIQAGIFNASTKRRLDELEATKEKLELSIIKEEMKKPQFTREQIQFYILQFRKVDTNTLEGRRRLIDGFVNSVVAYDDYILVTFNYKEGAERITFEQIERSDLSSFVGPAKAGCFIKNNLLLQLFTTFTPNHYLPSALTISLDYLSQEGSFLMSNAQLYRVPMHQNDTTRTHTASG